MKTIIKEAEKDGYRIIADGTNASDNTALRPGFKALTELSVYSPLKICGLTKQDIRKKSKKAGLFTWNKPSYSCLATRISEGTPLDLHLLQITEKAENFLFSLGFSDFRVRYLNGGAKIQVKKEQMKNVLKHSDEILNNLKNDYSSIVLDLEARE